MPISSGALGWPESYFRKPEDEEDSLTRNSIETGEGQGQNVWTVQLADRDQFEQWKYLRDKDAEKRRKKLKRKKKKEQKKAQKEIIRNNIDNVIRRRRHGRFCCLVLTSALLSTLILLGSITLFTYYLDEDELGPPVFRDSECEGKWRTHFLAFKSVLPNGTVDFTCCYMPDVNASARYYVLAKGDVWPDGYLIRNQDCTPNGNNCKYYEKNNLFQPGTPPCAGHCVQGVHFLVLFSTLIARLMIAVCQ